VSTEEEGPRRAPTVRDFLEMKIEGKPIVALTAYDVLFAGLVEEAGVDLILVGDSLGQVVLGHPSTLPVTLEDMIRHAAAVRRGAPASFVVVDMPFLSYQVSVEETVRNAGRIMKEAGVQAVKLEGGSRRVLDAVDALVAVGIPVMGHLGLTPQSVHALGGHRVQGRDELSAEVLKEGARALEAAGVFSVVLELIPGRLAGEISRSLAVPTIGIGAGPECDGQVLVLYDALGLNADFHPRFLKRFAELHDIALDGVRAYVREVREGTYPGPEHTFS
jgi:3-methyl-2-oxobutanoate hydroxymethyltransferase